MLSDACAASPRWQQSASGGCFHHRVRSQTDCMQMRVPLQFFRSSRLGANQTRRVERVIITFAFGSPYYDELGQSEVGWLAAALFVFCTVAPSPSWEASGEEKQTLKCALSEYRKTLGAAFQLDGRMLAHQLVAQAITRGSIMALCGEDL